MNIIEINHLTKRYGDHVAVDDISLNIEKNEVLGLLGPNGAGKTTTMNIITGFISATSGTVTIDGADILQDPIRAKKCIGYLPEIPPLYKDMTVWEYLSFVFRLKKCLSNQRQHLEEICQKTGLLDVSHRLIGNLSKGYQQRTGIAQALVGNPSILILDEPTVGLDPAQIIEIRELIRELGREHTVILSTHILSEAQLVCDKIVMIYNGKLVSQNLTHNLGKGRTYRAEILGEPQAILSALSSLGPEGTIRSIGKNQFIIEQSTEIDLREELFYILAKERFPLVGMCEESISLEQVFMNVLLQNKRSDE